MSCYWLTTMLIPHAENAPRWNCEVCQHRLKARDADLQLRLGRRKEGGGDRTARTVSARARTSRQYVTGAAAITLVVNTPAATASPSAAISARSAFPPFARMPACMPARQMRRI